MLPAFVYLWLWIAVVHGKNAVFYLTTETANQVINESIEVLVIDTSTLPNTIQNHPNIESIVFLESSNTTIIPENTFSNIVKLSNIYLPSSLIEIQASAFEDCISLTSIVLPKNVQVQSRSFAGCINLQSITNIPTWPSEIQTQELPFINTKCQVELTVFPTEATSLCSCALLNSSRDFPLNACDYTDPPTQAPTPEPIPQKIKDDYRHLTKTEKVILGIGIIIFGILVGLLVIYLQRKYPKIFQTVENDASKVAQIAKVVV